MDRDNPRIILHKLPQIRALHCQSTDCPSVDPCTTCASSPTHYFLTHALLPVCMRTLIEWWHTARLSRRAQKSSHPQKRLATKYMYVEKCTIINQGMLHSMTFDPALQSRACTVHKCTALNQGWLCSMIFHWGDSILFFPLRPRLHFWVPSEDCATRTAWTLGLCRTTRGLSQCILCA